jgi:hypothetical protein
MERLAEYTSLLQKVLKLSQYVVNMKDRITILTSEQIQMVLDDWYDKLDSSDEFTN